MIKNSRNTRWTCREYKLCKSSWYRIETGDALVGMVKDKGDAELICRVKLEASRLASEVQRGRHRMRNLHQEYRTLQSALKRVEMMLRRAGAPDLALARNELGHVMRKLENTGH